MVAAYDIRMVNQLVERESAFLDRLFAEVNKVIVGQRDMIERVFMGLLCGGHVLLEGAPGLAKTLTVNTLARSLELEFKRVQFTPDLLPADVVGTVIYNHQSGTFTNKRGPVFTNLLLADEINRAPAKVQSALLEVMAERHVSIGGTTYPMPDPFLVMATQNPIENEGVYPLPEAQRDRFLFKVLVGYPSVEEEREIVYRMGNSVPTVSPVLDPQTMVRLQKVAGNVFVHHALVDYVVRVINATRRPAEVGLGEVAGWLSYGASPRATLGIVAAARALALVRGRDYVIPQDVVEMIPDVLRHRLVLSYDALADEVDADQVITRVLQTVGLPQVGTQATTPAAYPQTQVPQAQQNGQVPTEAARPYGGQ